jgi:osmotically-inducible protein OsmY
MMLTRRSIGLLAGSALVASLAACAGSSTSESTGQYVDDSTITTKVKAALIADQSLKAFDIHVETFKNVVQLSGFVNSATLAARAGTVAAGVAGVKGVKNDLVVK